MSGVVGDRQFFVGSDHHHQIVASRPVRPVEPERLSNQPLETVSTDGVATSPTDRESETEVVGLVRERIDEERPGFAAGSCGMDGGEGTLPLQPIV